MHEQIIVCWMCAMPEQETFFEATSGDSHIRVLKTYDQVFAREAFDEMDDNARVHLWHSLGIDELYDPNEIPSANDSSRHDFLWAEVEDAAREDGNRCSFFVVNETRLTHIQNVYVSPDWPSAEAFAVRRMNGTY